jgi:hypothetical protein
LHVLRGIMRDNLRVFVVGVENVDDMLAVQLHPTYFQRHTCANRRLQLRALL